MEQRDYILREIEKIGAILSAIGQKMFGGNNNLAITLETQIENAKRMLLNEANFDLDKFLELNIKESNEYICSFNGFNVENIELLADYIFQTGLNDTCDNSKKYLEKALQLYDLCNLKSKTYSFDRETNIKEIKNVLK
jgi:hypothetical protein